MPLVGLITPQLAAGPMVSNGSFTGNTAVGYAAAQNVSGNYNVGVGKTALANLTTATGSVGVGVNALQTDVGGSYNTSIGFSADVASGALTNATAIGNSAIVALSNSMQFGNISVVGWGFGNAQPTATEVFIVGTTSTNGNGAYLTAGGVWTNAEYPRQERRLYGTGQR